MIQYLLHKSVSCCTAEIGQALDLSSYQARHYLQLLEKEKKISRTPSARGSATIWTVTDELKKAASPKNKK
ncbi:hypothetical protein NCL57_004711 [Salmonella enterica]|nr:hypothetical protein [Salmonella enterica]EJH1054743.1 hypothetical protein [Salmonella enterica]